MPEEYAEAFDYYGKFRLNRTKFNETCIKYFGIDAMTFASTNSMFFVGGTLISYGIGLDDTYPIVSGIFLSAISFLHNSAMNDIYNEIKKNQPSKLENLLS